MKYLKKINWHHVWLYTKLVMAILLGPIAAWSYFSQDDAVLIFLLAIMGWIEYIIEKAEELVDDFD